MEKENQALALRDEAAHQLAQIKDIETGSKYLNEMKAIEIWAKAEKKDAELQNLIAEQKLRTQRRLGSLIREGQKQGEVEGQGGARNFKINKPNFEKPKTLKEVGLTPHQSMDYQTIAGMPNKDFEEEIEKAQKESDKRVELTTSRVLKAAKRREKFNEQHTASDPIFSETSKLLLKAGDKLQYIIQGDYIPKTTSDFVAIDSIRHHMYRFVRMAGQLGIKLDIVWEKTAARHGIKNEMPEHLQDKKGLHKKENKNSDMDDAEIVD